MYLAFFFTFSKFFLWGSHFFLQRLLLSSIFCDLYIFFFFVIYYYYLIFFVIYMISCTWRIFLLFWSFLWGYILQLQHNNYQLLKFTIPCIWKHVQFLESESTYNSMKLKARTMSWIVLSNREMFFVVRKLKFPFITSFSEYISWNSIF